MGGRIDSEIEIDGETEIIHTDTRDRCYVRGMFIEPSFSVKLVYL